MIFVDRLVWKCFWRRVVVVVLSGAHWLRDFKKEVIKKTQRRCEVMKNRGQDAESRLAYREESLEEMGDSL